MSVVAGRLVTIEAGNIGVFLKVSITSQLSFGIRGLNWQVFQLFGSFKIIIPLLVSKNAIR